MSPASAHASITVTEELTRKVAALARLDLSDAEVSAFTSQLGDILRYVGQLQEVDVTGVEPLGSPVEGQEVMRPDEARPSPVDEEGKPKVLSSASDVLAGGFKVPPIL